MNDKIKQLYKTVIIQHNKHPYHFEQVTNPPHTVQGNNPLCGDRFDVYLAEAPDPLQQLHFHGFGCAISKASASLMVQLLEGKSQAEALTMCEAFLSYLDDEALLPQLPHTDLEAFGAVHQHPARKDCAALTWRAMHDYLTNQ